MSQTKEECELETVLEDAGSEVVQDMRAVAVLGAGPVGSGVAQVAATAGYQVFFTDLDQRTLDRGVSSLRQRLDRAVNNGRMVRPVRDAIIDRLEPVRDLDEVCVVDLVLECISEDQKLKSDLFRNLNSLCPAHTILATGTSTLSVTELALASGRPDRFLGIHFPNPPEQMKLVELVRTPLTSPGTLQACRRALDRMQRSPVEVRDAPGFLVNRLVMPYLNEAVWALFEGVGEVLDLDRALVLGGSLPEGPFAHLDRLGLDVVLGLCEALYRRSHDPRFRPCPLLRRMVQAGHLGRKSAKGFYDYGGEEPQPVDVSHWRV